MADRFDEEVERFRKLLAALVRERGVSIRSLERKLGAKGGQTRKVLKGDLTLSLRHILMILDALEVPQAKFFQAACAPERPSDASSSDDWLAEMLNDPRILELVSDRLAVALVRSGAFDPSTEEH